MKSSPILVTLFLLLLPMVDKIPADDNKALLFEKKANKTEDKNSPEVLGKKVFRKACAACHGLLGDGKGPASRHLQPQPRDFTIAQYKFRSTPGGELPTDEDLIRTISSGLKGTRMPAFKKLLSKKQINNVVAYIKTFSEDFAKAEYNVIKIPKEPKMTSKTVTEGKHLYMMFECWTCHGPDGKGNGANASEMKDDEGRPLYPADISRGKIKSGSSTKDLYRTINTGINGTPMPSFGDLFLFGGGDMDVESYRKEFSAPWTASLKAYFKNQPTDDEIATYSESQKEALANKRRWALIHYIKKLIKPSGFMGSIFTKHSDDTK